jgi:hypothetical protein
MCLNLAEGAGRAEAGGQGSSLCHRAGRDVEAIAAVEIAVMCRQAKKDAFRRVLGVGNRLNAMLTKLIR